jgi:hypothetical protein
MDWDYVKQFHLNPPPTADYLPRNKNSELKYEEHKKQIQSKNITIKDYILITHFNNPLSVQKGWVIVDNSFPYNLKPNIRHLLIWIYPGKEFSNEQIIQIIENYMKENKHTHYVYFRHNVNIQSVPEINHYHIFIKIF